MKLDDTDLRMISSRLSAVTNTLGILSVIMGEAAESEDIETAHAAATVLLEIHNAINIGIREIYERLEIELPTELGAVH